MIDKLELRLPRLTQFQAKVREFILESNKFENSARTRRSGHYEWVTDLRPIGIDAILHFSLKREENDPHEGEHKLELIDTGEKSYSELDALISSVVEGPIEDLEVMRIDLCVDLYEVPVEWFLANVRVRFKRVAHEMGILKYQLIGARGIQTLTAGKRPNLVRIYDKKAELKLQLRKRNRMRSCDSDELTLHSEFGISEQATITRVERQFGGGRIPRQIDSFGKLSNLVDYDPFTNIVFSDHSSASIPTVDECGLDMWLAGTRLRELKREMGEQQFHRFLNCHSPGNAARIKKRFRDFLNPRGESHLDSRILFEKYRGSVQEQLAA
jgi:hypothetical protein